ncbi:MAG: hypothetical protein RBR67_07080 [Desulfobacterium sp.]|nr:hypothetical protein [Desulfobacterium sp.]
MNRESLYHRMISVCIILGGVAAWNLFLVPSAPASPFAKSEIQGSEIQGKGIELQEQDMESVPELEDGLEQDDLSSTPDEDESIFNSQPQDESIMNPRPQEEGNCVDENVLDENLLDEEVLDEEALDEIEGLEELPDENLEPPPPAE